MRIISNPERPIENVWEYPRPPRLEKVADPLKIVIRDIEIARSANGYRVLETTHPPTYYIPPEDLRMDLLEANPHRTYCEWKGSASYFDFQLDHDVIPNIAWCYTNPSPSFQPISGYLSFYAHLCDACFVAGEQVQAQRSRFYGGWITSWVKGPFKGDGQNW